MHVSICQINYNKQNQNLEIYIHVFTDDLITALKSRNAPELFLGENKELPQTDSLINSYLKSKLSILVNDKATDISFIGKEIETDAVWCYYETKKIDEPKKITVYCEILTEIFDTQSNIIQFTKNNEMLSLIFDKLKTEGSINF